MMDRDEIAQTLTETEEVRLHARRALRSSWFPLLLFGTLTLVSSLLWLIGDGTTVAVYWAFAGPLGGIVTGVYYARREAALGLSRTAVPYIAVAVGLIAGAFVLPMLTSGDLQEVASNFAVGAGYLGFAWIERDRRVAYIAVAIVAVPVVMLAVAPASAGAVSAMATGSILVGSGLALRRTQSPSARPFR